MNSTTTVIYVNYAYMMAHPV